MKIKDYIRIEYVRDIIPTRNNDAHKGECGKVLLFAGSKGMSGAATMAGLASLKTGTGLITVCTKKNLFSMIQTYVPEIICLKWGKTKKKLRDYDAIAIGPGMRVCKRTSKIIKKVLTEYNKTVIIDADGLNTISAKPKLQELVRNYSGEIIMTPHFGEAARLLGTDKISSCNKLETGAALWSNYRAITVVKGASTLVVTGSDAAFENTTGNPGMATAGAGDVLTGVILALAGMGMNPKDAAKAGVFIHGLAGDLQAEYIGQYGLTATDIAGGIPIAIKHILEYIKIEEPEEPEIFKNVFHKRRFLRFLGKK